MPEPQHLAEPVGPDKRREPGGQIPLRDTRRRQKVLVPPDRGGPGADPRPKRLPGETAQVILRLEGPKTMLAHEDWFHREPASALAADQSAYSHLSPPSLFLFSRRAGIPRLRATKNPLQLRE